MGDQAFVADVGQAGRDADVGQREHLATEHQRLFRQAEADTARADYQRIVRHHAAAAQADGQQVGHAKQGAHATNVHHVVGLAREAVNQATDVAGGAAHIDHHRVVKPGQKSRAAHRIGRAGRKAVDRVAGRQFGQHHRAVVLGQVKRCVDTYRAQGLAKRTNHVVAKLGQAGVEQGDVFALQQTNAPEPVRQGDADPRTDVGDDLLRAQFVLGCQRRKNRRDADGVDTRVADTQCRFPQRIFVQRHKRPAVEFMAAFDHENHRVHHVAQILGPVHHGRQRGRCRQTDTDRGHAHQVTPLHHRIDEMRGAYHHRVNRLESCASLGYQLAQAVQHTPHHVLGGGRLDRQHHALVFHQHGIRIGAAYIDTDSFHGSNTDLNSRSCPKARGPTCCKPLGVSNTGAAGSAITVARWP